ncbi:recombinase family protein, partial [Paraburkholderia sp. EG285A]|uniref:recombinase family protein n=1 Tax=Paraburkholderia sp. EG285A TaxID=3237009 RepID=UPI0034D26486
DSQIAALKERIQADGAQIVEDMCFVDAGVSGATLVRPQLERLHGAAFHHGDGQRELHRSSASIWVGLRSAILFIRSRANAFR